MMSKEIVSFEQPRIDSWQKFAHLQASIIERMTYLSMHDNLIPEIYNQQGLEWIYYDPEERAKRVRKADLDKPDTAIMFDMDDFKRINDTYKHEGGDQALRRVALGITEEIQKRTRPSDLLARIHGDEFVLVLLGTPQANALKFAQELAQRVHEVGLSDDGVGETISMGVAEIPDRDLAEGIRRADVALYDAKGNGRNQAVEYDGVLVDYPKQS